MNRPKITALLVDDEEHCTDTLAWMLQEYCPQVQVLRAFNAPAEALKFLQGEQPDLLFLDIEMPVLNAFDLLKAVEPLRSAVVFTTAYDAFAIDAIKHNALDYLLKPVDKDELQLAVRKAMDRKPVDAIAQRMDDLLERMAPRSGRTRLAVPTRTGLEMVDAEAILYAKADNNYTELHLDGAKRFVVSRTLKDMEKELPMERFLRIHVSYTVALARIQRYVRGTGGYVVLDSGEQLPVSRAHKDELMERLGGA